MDDQNDAGSPTSPQENIDLYELLGVEKTATPDQIKKAYRKAALQHHPDKVEEEHKEAAEAKFKAVTQAYEILRDEEKREMYDQHGMAAFDPSRGGGGEGVDLNDILSQMFGFGMGGPGGPGGPRGPRGPRRGPDEEQEYKVTLEDLYKGKTVKFAANKRIICGTCDGSGAKENVKPADCNRCGGSGVITAMRQMGPLITQQRMACDNCEGAGKTIKEKDRCKKCKGKRTVTEDKVLEIYIPRGSMQGETIVLEGEADQHPDTVPGNIVFTLVEESHDVFSRIGPDLAADLHVSLAEALCGFSRVVLVHLDGRGIHLTRERGQVLRPNQVLRIDGEGMPLKKGEDKGDLYLTVKIDFPEDGWLGAEGEGDDKYAQLTTLLPPPGAEIKAEVVDEVEYDSDADLETMGEQSSDPRFNNGGEWEDDDEGHAHGGAQCQTQ
jgi:DnaJ family protein A protein 2